MLPTWVLVWFSIFLMNQTSHTKHGKNKITIYYSKPFDGYTFGLLEAADRSCILLVMHVICVFFYCVYFLNTFLYSL